MDWGAAHRKAATYTQTQNKGRQTSMLSVVFEPTIPLFEQAKTFYALERADTMIGTDSIN
jgi:hypothetical protein